MTSSFWKRPESMFVSVCLILSILGVLFVHSLIGPPKMLFGESLTAITPSVFPSTMLTLIAILCAAQLTISFRTYQADELIDGVVSWRRGIVFFGIMTGYGLLLVPLGFIVSSGIAVAMLSWFVGNRMIWQIILVATTAPLLLYLAATRLLSVSLPELNFIELAISRILGS